MVLVGHSECQTLPVAGRRHQPLRVIANQRLVMPRQLADYFHKRQAMHRPKWQYQLAQLLKQSKSCQSPIFINSYF
jgi:hypothetical protein